jgi:hypothetical protein
MKEGGIGGANTLTGLAFERNVDFQDLLAKTRGYEVKDMPGKAGKGVYFKGNLVARCFRKNSFYDFLDEEGVDWKPKMSRKLLPDDALLVIVRETLFIIDVKYQHGEGSVDEKLQTCDFKRKQYVKLVAGLGLKVEYVYVLNDWFKQAKYRDVLDYINSVNCHLYRGILQGGRQSRNTARCAGPQAAVSSSWQHPTSARMNGRTGDAGASPR